MTRNQMPEGVGKKIVEALKRQAEADITPVSGSKKEKIEEFSELEDFSEYEEQLTTLDNSSDDMIIEESGDDEENRFEIMPQNNVEMPDISNNIPEPEQTLAELKETESDEIDNVLEQTEEKEVKPEPVAKEQPILKPFNTEAITPVTPIENKPVSNVKPQSVQIPYNVAVLNNLIATLPSGVNKQTGALIIRQTLEAMGIPMTGVLKEAQELQEQLNTSAKDCMIKVQSYKTNILQLERSIQEYQRNMTQINDLISLFLTTDKK